MNFFLYVATLLLLLAISSQAFLNILSSDKKIESSYQGYMNASRKAASAVEKNRYDLIPKEKLAAQKKDPTKKKAPIKKQTQMVNIFPLLTEGKEKRPLLYSFLTHLFLNLYGDRAFFPQKNKEKMAALLVDALVESAQKQKENRYLEKLELREPCLQKLFYKMLKGSQPFAGKNQPKKEESLQEHKEGIRSLFEFVYSSPDPREDRIPIVFVSPPILASLFNQEVAKRILLYQEKTKTMISEETLRKIFQETHFSPQEELWKYLDFSQKKSHFPFEISSSEDEKTHIFITRKNFLSSKSVR